MIDLQLALRCIKAYALFGAVACAMLICVPSCFVGDTFPISSLTRFKLVDPITDGALMGVKLSATATSHAPGVAIVSSTLIPMPMTDANGITYAPYAVTFDESLGLGPAIDSVEWEIHVEHQGRIENITVRNANGSSAAGGFVRITVETNSAFAPIPAGPILSSNGIITIDSFVSSILVCDNDLSQIVHWFDAPGLGNYVYSVAALEPPQGFIDHSGSIVQTCSAAEHTRSCDVTIIINYFDRFVESAMIGASRRDDNEVGPCGITDRSVRSGSGM